MKGWQDENGGKDIKNRCLSQTQDQKTLAQCTLVFHTSVHKLSETLQSTIVLFIYQNRRQLAGQITQELTAREGDYPGLRVCNLRKHFVQDWAQ